MDEPRPGLMPKARIDRLIIKELPEETLVYDLDTDKAHCLNKSAALVLKHCDGHNSVRDISTLYQNEARSLVAEDVVWLALDQLHAANLIIQVPPRPSHLTGLSRRQAIRALGLAAVALPIVVSIVSPTPAEAASPCVAGQACTSPADCCNSFPTCVTSGAPAGRGCRP